MNFSQATRNTQLENDTFGLISRLQERFRKLQEAIWLTVIKFPPRLGPSCQINYLFELTLGYPSYPIQK